MATVNLEGRISKEIDLYNGAQPILTITVAEKHQRKNRQTGEYEDKGTTWWEIKAFGEEAERLAETYRHGDIIQVAGRSETREWTAKDGTKGRTLEIYDPALRLKKRFNDTPNTRTNTGFGRYNESSKGFQQSPGGFGASHTTQHGDDEPPF